MHEAPGTPSALARHLATYITDDSAIVAHLKHRFGVKWDVSDIAKIRGSLPRHIVRGRQDVSFTTEKPLATARKGQPDPLAAALWKYGSKHGLPNMTAEDCKRRMLAG